MDFLYSKIASLKRSLTEKGLYDTRFVGLLLIGFIGVSVFWNGAKIIQQNFELARKVEAVRQENALIDLENKNKEYQNKFLATDEYAELTARRIFGKAAEGEKVYIVPKDVALKELVTPMEAPEVKGAARSEKPAYQKNLEAWLGVYFGN